jgi:hypothetical protein
MFKDLGSREKYPQLQQKSISKAKCETACNIFDKNFAQNIEILCCLNNFKTYILQLSMIPAQ